MRHYELMLILDPSTDERNISSNLENYLKIIRNDGGSIENIDVWGRRRLAYEINKHSEGVYVVLDINSEPASVQELDRQLKISEIVLRTKIQRRVHEPRKEARAAAHAARLAARSARRETTA